jgi:hypothetical protein
MSRAAATGLPPFSRRHIGADEAQIGRMLHALGCASLGELIDQTVPETIRLRRPLALPEPLDEPEALAEIRALADKICHRPVWVDLKGADSIPTCVHHVVVEVDPRADTCWASPAAAALQTDGVHAASTRRSIRWSCARRPRYCLRRRRPQQRAASPRC